MRSITLLVFLFSFISPVSEAFADNGNAHLWDDVSVLIEKCVVQPYAIDHDGHKVVGNLLSVCSEIKHARGGYKIVLDGQVYYATMSESADSDGGDLFDIQIVNSKSEVVGTRQNVLAMNDLLLGLVGGDANIQQKYDLSVLKHAR